jgi:hypothetical protein
MINFDQPVSIVANDAGGANQIISFIKNKIQENESSNIRPYMTGPAKVLWAKEFPNIKIYDSLKECLLGVSILISGTGWQTDIEKEAIKTSKEKKIYSIAFLDHWVNYKDRFTFNNSLEMPDEIWVADRHALNIARKTFLNFKKIKQIENYYVKDLVKKINKKNEKNQILYILEPIRSDWNNGDLEGEFQALDYFLDNFKKINIPNSIKIILKPHPSEDSGKYDQWVKSNKGFNIDISYLPLEDLISESKYIIGCNSFALYISMIAKKIVFCSLPPWAGNSSIPMNKINYLRDL